MSHALRVVFCIFTVVLAAQANAAEPKAKAVDKKPLAALAPRHVDVPDVAGLDSPLDRLLAGYYQKNSFTPSGVVDDRTFARRVYLDLIGLIPTAGQLEAFSKDTRPDKRAQLVDALLANKDGYAQHWLTFWNDALRNDYRGTGYIDGGRQQITGWLYKSLAENKPYDQFVRELINPTPESAGFVKGIVWRGVVNASQVPEVQAAQNVSQVFMGINIKCASCHDSFINSWKLSDAYGLAGVFADQKLEMHHCDSPIGEFASLKFLYPELGEIDAKASKPERLKRLSELVTSPQNGRLTRTIVNRLWGRLLGRALVEPVDDMDAPAWNADVLDWLASDLAEHRYDLKHTLRTITTSRAYQLPSVPATEHDDKFVFHGPLVRRMAAEQFVDAISILTGGGYPKAEAPVQTSEKPAFVRASLVAADPLMVALGRPNREQVVTNRSTAATTLQALELTNGATLESWLEHGAEHWTQKKLAAPELVNQLYLGALGRLPHDDERAAAIALLGTPVGRDGLTDMLWTLAMLPEFQLIY